VQPRAPAVYNTIRNRIVVFCAKRWERRETKLTQVQIEIVPAKLDR